jgi:hypothetical protein
MIGSTVMGGVSAIQQGNAAAASASYNAKVSTMNAEIMDKNARDAIERGKIEEQQKRFEIAALTGRQRAAMAANGVDLSFGSPLDTIVDTAMLGELDALTIRSNAAREAYDYKVAGANNRADASLSRANASSARTGGYLSAFGTILGGGSEIGKYRASQRVGTYA